MAVNEYRYPLRMPAKESADLHSVAKQTKHSINDVLLLAIRKGLPLAKAALSQDAGRITNVDPLPDRVLSRLYRQREDDEESIAKLIAAQPIGAE